MIDDARFEALRDRLGPAARQEPRTRPPDRRRGHFHAALAGRPRAHSGPAQVGRWRRCSAPNRRSGRSRLSRRARSVACSPRPAAIFEPESAAADPWGAARAFAAAGFRRGDLVVNSFTYHLTPAGRSWRAARRRSAAPVIPAGPGNTEQQFAAIAASQARRLFRHARFPQDPARQGREPGSDVSSIRKALVSGAALPPSLRAELEGARHPPGRPMPPPISASIAYETDGADGALPPGCRQRRPDRRDRDGRAPAIPLPAGKRRRGRRDPARPATIRCCASPPAISRPVLGARAGIKGWMGRADQSTKVKGMFVHPEPDRRDRQAPSASSARRGWSSGATANRTR